MSLVPDTEAAPELPAGDDGGDVVVGAGGEGGPGEGGDLALLHRTRVRSVVLGRRRPRPEVPELSVLVLAVGVAAALVLLPAH